MNHHHRLLHAFAAIMLVAAGTLTATAVAPPAARADGCYTWSRTLREGMSGADVTQLQIRVAGWAGYRVVMSIDGVYGPQTKTAVSAFQGAYGLTRDGVAGPQTFNKIYELQKDDCSPAHFAWTEVDGGCGQGGYSGGSVSAATVKENLKRVMWRAEALRHQLGDKPIPVNSGFRSQACDKAVGGSGTGQHTYGTALDLDSTSSLSLCTIAKQARYAGFGGILGPGYPDHNDHVHVDIRSAIFWSAPTCGVS